MKKFYLILAFVLLATISIQTNAQSVVNFEWNQAYGLPDTIDWMATCFDIDNNIIVTGNKKVSGGNTNIYTAKFDTSGTIIWVKYYSYTSGQKDYGVAVVTDTSNNIYIAGTSYIDSTNNYDYTTIMYNKDGILQWVKQYNGTGSGDDVATAIAYYEGDIFVTGISKGDTTYEDYATIKYNSNGVVQWVTRYDYTNLVEIPAAIEFIDNGNVLITGASGSSITSWDITTVKYNNSNGNEIDVKREPGSGYGFDKPADMRKDNQGNIVITGQVRNLQGNYDIKTIKMDSNLDTVWTTIYDGHNLNDIPSAMDVDINGNIYITGYSDNGSGKEMVNLMYDSAGNLTWLDKIFSHETNGVAKGKQIKVDLHGNFYATGVVDHENTKDIITMRYDTAQNVRWRRYYNGDNNNDDKPYDMIINNKGKVYVSGITDNGDKYVTLKYSTFDKPENIVQDTISGDTITFKAQQLLVKFDTSVVIKNNIDNLGLQWGGLSKFLKSEMVSDIVSILPDGTKESDITVTRIFDWLTTKDSLSLTRLGDTIKVPPFWAEFLIVFPVTQNELKDIRSDLVLLGNIKSSGYNIKYSMNDTPNDTHFGLQKSLYTSNPTYEDGDINCTNAWDIETGESFVLVATIGSGITQNHPDLPSYIAGRDFINDCSIPNNNYSLGSGNSNYHESCCAGIIGAKRDNGIGVAGIAGGGVNSTGGEGVQLWDARVEDITDVKDAIVYMSYLGTGTGCPGNQIDLLNSSLTWLENSSNDPAHYSNTVDEFRFAFKSHLIIACSMGNENTANIGASTPQKFNDNWVLAVGASNQQGLRLTGVSNYGNNMDIIAPGQENMIYTTGITGYRHFRYTSAATPHVTGVVALLLSHVNASAIDPDNLTTEDAEHIIQYSAHDPTSTAAGWDEETAWGLLDAQAALEFVEKPYYKIRHYKKDKSYSNIETIAINDNYTESLGNGEYRDRYYVLIEKNQYIDQSETIEHNWIRYASSNYNDDVWGTGWGQSNEFGEEMQFEFQSICNHDAVIKAYVWRYHNGSTTDYWAPHQYNGKITVAYSVHTYNATAGVEKFDTNTDMYLGDAYPNPANSSINVPFYISNLSNVNIDIIDISGKIVQSHNLGQIPVGSYKQIINTTNMEIGVYFYRLRTDYESLTKRMIIIR